MVALKTKDCNFYGHVLRTLNRSLRRSSDCRPSLRSKVMNAICGNYVRQQLNHVGFSLNSVLTFFTKKNCQACIL